MLEEITPCSPSHATSSLLPIRVSGTWFDETAGRALCVVLQTRRVSRTTICHHDKVLLLIVALTVCCVASGKALVRSFERTRFTSEHEVHSPKRAAKYFSIPESRFVEFACTEQTARKVFIHVFQTRKQTNYHGRVPLNLECEYEQVCCASLCLWRFARPLYPVTVSQKAFRISQKLFRRFFGWLQYHHRTAAGAISWGCYSVLRAYHMQEY